MSLLDEAIQLDIAAAKVVDEDNSSEATKKYGGKVILAAEAYEQITKGAAPTSEVYINLAVLYWQSTDYGFSASTGLPRDFISYAGERYGQLIHEASELHPDVPEIFFWKLYFDFVTLGEPPFVEQCKSLVAMP